MTNEDDVAGDGGKNELWILVVDAERNNRSLSILSVVLSNDMIYFVCKLLLSAVVATVVFDNAFAFSPQPRLVGMRAQGTHLAMSEDPNDVLNKAIAMMSGGGQDQFETPDMTQARVRALVDQHPVLLFMKGAKSFPQCGFSDTATKILDSFEDIIDYHTVDVLADSAIRDGVKIFSQWPTIPQLYIGGEFIGGSDIMIDLYQSGELKEMIIKVAKVK
ncbi:monothiol glutaredoxin [Fragilaria crotonensis]|nr:monothiol glutaredoxin [Fragilaria crotonensis]